MAGNTGLAYGFHAALEHEIGLNVRHNDAYSPNLVVLHGDILSNLAASLEKLDYFTTVLDYLSFGFRTTRPLQPSHTPGFPKFTHS
jgi:UDP-2,3-diacylglucosamine pyrophosphatase LpxH